MQSSPIIPPGTPLIDRQARTARFRSMLRSSDGVDLISAELEDGTGFAMPPSLLEKDGEVYRFRGDFHDLVQTEAELARIPVVEEKLEVGRRLVETGAGVRIVKTVQQMEQTVDIPLASTQYSVERHARDELLPEGEPPGMRTEADGTVVLPVLEEVLVVQKRLRLKEEIRITPRHEQFHSPQRVKLREENVEVEAFDRKRS